MGEAFENRTRACIPLREETGCTRNFGVQDYDRPAPSTSPNPPGFLMPLGSTLQPGTVEDPFLCSWSRQAPEGPDCVSAAEPAHLASPPLAALAGANFPGTTKIETPFAKRPPQIQ